MKVGLPKSNGTMSVNFPFILPGNPSAFPASGGGAGGVQRGGAVQNPGDQVVLVRSNLYLRSQRNHSDGSGLARVCAAGWDCTLEVAPALAIAATIYFFSNTILVALVIGWSERRNR